jgi:hypothetical protein
MGEPRLIQGHVMRKLQGKFGVTFDRRSFIRMLEQINFVYL